MSHRKQHMLLISIMNILNNDSRVTKKLFKKKTLTKQLNKCFSTKYL